MTDPRGLPGRPWYTNLLVAPALANGHAGKTLPGVREALEQGQWQSAEEHARRTARALGAGPDQLERATAMLRLAD